MDIRTFEAFNMKDAVKNVKRELGQDAVILSTREKAGPNGKGTIVEVTAAAPESKKIGGSSRQGRPSHLNQAPDNNYLAASVKEIDQRLEKIQESSSTRRQIESIESSLIEMKAMLIENLAQKNGSIIENLPKSMTGIVRTLTNMAVDPGNIAELITYLKKLPDPDGNIEQKENHYKDQAIRYMMKRIMIAPRWTVMPGTTSIQAMVGSYGVGKSTVVAKLAAFYHMKRNAKVCVVSYDNNRLAAAEQMRVYCKIIGVPFQSISTSSALDEVIDRNPETELILIDTAGSSSKSESALAEIEELKGCSSPVDFHLCLSITEKEAQQDRSIRNFSQLGLQSLIFTKLDESWSFGEIFNLSKRWTLPLSYFSVGTEVPEDIERASRERVIEQIFGL
jgi:flagellar biosynthesis protein FlhF